MKLCGFVKNLNMTHDILIDKNMPYKDEEKRKEYYKQWRTKNIERNSILHRKYYNEHREAILKNAKNYYNSNKDKVKENTKKYREENKEYYRKYFCNYIARKKQMDEGFLIECRLRRLLSLKLSKYIKFGKTISSKKYGIDYGAIVKKLTPLPFPIEERSRWHIDHIKPCHAFDLTKSEEVKKCFAPENLQWLPAKENISKGKKTWCSS